MNTANFSSCVLLNSLKGRSGTVNDWRGLARKFFASPSHTMQSMFEAVALLHKSKDGMHRRQSGA